MAVHQLKSYLGPKTLGDGTRVHVYTTDCGKTVGLTKAVNPGTSARVGDGDEACPVCFPPQPQKPQAARRPAQEEEAPQDSNLDDSLGTLENEGDDTILEEQRDQWGETRA